MSDDATKDPKALLEAALKADDDALAALKRAHDATSAALAAFEGAAPSPAPGAPVPAPAPPAPPVVPTPSPTPAPTGGAKAPAVVALVNESTLASDGQVSAWGLAYGIQAHDVDAHWHCGVTEVIGPVKATAVPDGAVPLVFLDDADQAGALGYHDVDPHGRPYGRVFVRTTEQDGVAPSACGSHEFVEIMGDAPCDDYYPPIHEGDPQLALELGDPVEALSYWITPDGHPTVEVSDFVTPAYFGLVSSEAPEVFDLTGAVVISHNGATGTPGTPLAQGYQIIRDPSSGKVSEVFGEQYPTARLAAKQYPSARTARRLAAETA